MPRFAVSLAIAVALGIAAVVAALLIVWQVGLFGGGVTSGLGPVAQVGEVTHIQASMTLVEPDGTLAAAGSEETWVDTTGAFIRTEQRDSDGKVARVAVRKYNSVSGRDLDLNEQGVPRFGMESYPDSVSGWVGTEVGGPLYFRDFFRGDAVETVGQTEVDGRAAIIVRVPPPESGVNRRPVEGVVDEETGWPFEIRLFERNDAGGFDSAGKWVIKYELVESLPIESVAYLFDVESSDRSAGSFKEMSLGDARTFAGFPLLYLGDSFDGMALKSITVSSPRDDPLTQQVFLIYEEWAGNPPVRLVQQLDVVITPAPTEVATQLEPPPAWAGWEVVGTRRGEALFSEPSRLRLLTEGVIVDIQGDNTNREQILKAADALIALNPGAVRPSSPTP
ncbi:MAG TPA: hypothetical protein VJ578_05855 [Dehalococcoidia bacterium]|nr:hypothetical protein [Dehalococcoidia bacterium]